MNANYDQRLDTITEDCKSQFGELSLDQLNWKSNPDSWSIAQCIDHLIVINSSYFPIFESLKNGTYKSHSKLKTWLFASLFGNMILKAVQPDRKKRSKTQPIWQPNSSEITGDVVNKFVAHQTVVKQWLKDLKPHIESNTVIHSAASEKIIYRLRTAIEIIIQHEKRHLEQAKEVLNQQGVSMQ